MSDKVSPQDDKILVSEQCCKILFITDFIKEKNTKMLTSYNLLFLHVKTKSSRTGNNLFNDNNILGITI